ncbi:MAG: flagellar brake protein [Deltaproteobacteria bacterium]
MQLKDIKIGANFEIALFKEGEKPSKSYPVKVQNILDDKKIEFDAPFSQGQMISFQINTIIEAFTTTQEGIFSFRAKVIERTVRNNIPVIVIKPEAELEKKQRRAYFRLPFTCNIRYRKYKLPIFGENDLQFKTTTTIDISGGGICFQTEEKLDAEEFYECVIILDKDKDIEINTVGKPVCIVKENDADKFWKIGMKFERISETAREKIINFIFQEQLKLRRKGLV